MSNDMRVTLCGWLANTPELQRKGETCWTTFRLGVTPHYFDRRAERWTDGQTEWVRVSVWDEGFARNTAESLHKGDPVVVTGRLASEQWKGQDGVERMGLVMRAEAIGHNLKYGSARFARTANKTGPGGPAGPEDAADGGTPIGSGVPLGSSAVGSAQFDAVATAEAPEEEDAN
jgi:single-strand DNA-binding protein